MVFILGTFLFLIAVILSILNFIISEPILKSLYIASVLIFLLLPISSGGRVMLEDRWVGDNWRKQWLSIWISFNKSKFKWKWVLQLASLIFMIWYNNND
jgi:hypothetical protein